MLAEVSLTVASSVIHPLAHSLTPRHLLPLSSPSNHSRVLPLKREPPERQRPTSLSPHLGTAPPLILAPPTLLTLPPPPQLTQHTPLAHRHSLKTRFVARERLELQRTHHVGEEVELMKSPKEVVPMNFCLGSEVVLDLPGRPIHRSLVHLLLILARQEVATPAAGVEPILVPAGGMEDNHTHHHNIRWAGLVPVVLLHSPFMGLVILTHWRPGYKRL